MQLSPSVVILMTITRQTTQQIDKHSRIYVMCKAIQKLQYDLECMPANSTCRYIDYQSKSVGEKLKKNQIVKTQKLGAREIIRN